MRPASSRVDRHHLGVRHDVGPADLEDARQRLRVLDRGDEVAQDVADRDRLAAGVHPLRRHHHGQHLGEVAQHLEARRAGADHDGGAELDRLDRARGEHPTDVVAAAEMLAQVGVVVTESTEVDDAPDTRPLGGTPEVLGDGPFARDPVGALTDAVDEEHRDVDAVHRLAEVAADVGAHDLDVRTPGRRVELAGIAHDTSHGVPAREQLGHEPTTDIARRTGDEHTHRSVQLAMSSRARARRLCASLPPLITYAVRRVTRHPSAVRRNSQWLPETRHVS